MAVIFGAFLLTTLVITAFAVVRNRDLFVSVMLTGIFSLQMAAVFFMLDAADVALTEAAVGAGVATVLMLSALALTDNRERLRKGLRLLPAIVLSAIVLLIISATFDMPRMGDPEAPVHNHVAPWYLEKTPELIGMPNVVTAILASFRGYDTLGELFVIFTAGIGVLFGFFPARRAARQVPHKWRRREKPCVWTIADPGRVPPDSSSAGGARPHFRPRPGRSGRGPRSPRRHRRATRRAGRGWPRCPTPGGRPPGVGLP